MNRSKLAPKLLSRLEAVSAQEAEEAPPIPAIVRYRPDVLRAQAVRDGIEARYVFSLTPTVAVAASGDLLGDLSDDEDIEYIWLDEEIHICLDRSLPQIGVPVVWAAGYRGAGIKIAIVDTGLDTTHPDFVGRVVSGAHFAGTDYRDDNGHGTHVAGIAAGDGRVLGGTYRGVAPEARLYIAKALDGNGSGSMSTVMAGIEWAVEQNVDVINLSLGGAGSGDGQDALSLTCNAAVARGIVVCVASGNAGPGSRTVGSPGAAADVITVGAVDRSDRVAPFSSRGPTADGRVKPDICLPGTDIVSARAIDSNQGQPVSDRYTSMSGTSMATPHASGLAVLLLQAKPDLTPAQVKQILMETALDLGGDQNAQGAGRARAEVALGRIVENVPVPTPEPTPPGEQPPSGAPKNDKEGCLPTFLIPFVGR